MPFLPPKKKKLVTFSSFNLVLESRSIKENGLDILKKKKYFEHDFSLALIWWLEIYITKLVSSKLIQ